VWHFWVSFKDCLCLLFAASLKRFLWNTWSYFVACHQRLVHCSTFVSLGCRSWFLADNTRVLEASDEWRPDSTFESACCKNVHHTVADAGLLSALLDRYDISVQIHITTLKVLSKQGLFRGQLHTVFLHWFNVSRLRYSLPAWSGWLSREQVGQINAFFKRIFRCGFSCKLIQLETLTSAADKRLFC